MHGGLAPPAPAGFAWLLLGLTVVAVAAAVSCVLFNYPPPPTLPPCVLVFCLHRHSLPPACFFWGSHFQVYPTAKHAAMVRLLAVP
jgi:hypothetical protein